MFIERKSESRGHVDLGWLNSFHSFSFGDYYDPSQMGFGVLRVINEDRIKGGTGFNTHGHRDMEIISYVLEGGLEHKDTLGTQSVILPGDVQRMSAGTGVRHSEFNANKEKIGHFLQIWILPDKSGHPPSYEQKSFQKLNNQWQLLASRLGREGSVSLNQDVDLWRLSFDGSSIQERKLERAGWVQVVAGELEINGLRLKAGDGLGIIGEPALTLKAFQPGELLFFDLPHLD